MRTLRAFGWSGEWRVSYPIPGSTKTTRSAKDDQGRPRRRTETRNDGSDQNHATHRCIEKVIEKVTSSAGPRASATGTTHRPFGRTENLAARTYAGNHIKA